MIHQITFRDGLVVQQEEPPVMAVTTTAVTVLLDGQMVPLGFALAKLIAERTRLVTELDATKTQLADIRAGELQR